MTPLENLPPELLVLIFSFLQVGWGQRGTSPVLLVCSSFSRLKNFTIHNHQRTASQEFRNVLAGRPGTRALIEAVQNGKVSTIRRLQLIGWGRHYLSNMHLLIAASEHFAGWYTNLPVYIGLNLDKLVSFNVAHSSNAARLLNDSSSKQRLKQVMLAGDSSWEGIPEMDRLAVAEKFSAQFRLNLTNCSMIRQLVINRIPNISALRDRILLYFKDTKMTPQQSVEHSLSLCRPEPATEEYPNLFKQMTPQVAMSCPDLTLFTHLDREPPQKRTDTLLRLAKNGVLIQSMGVMHHCVLHWGQCELQALVSIGCIVDERDARNFTPLQSMLDRRMGTHRLAQTLLLAGVHPNLQSGRRRSPRDYLVCRDDDRGRNCTMLNEANAFYGYYVPTSADPFHPFPHDTALTVCIRDNRFAASAKKSTIRRLCYSRMPHPNDLRAAIDTQSEWIVALLVAYSVEIEPEHIDRTICRLRDHLVSPQGMIRCRGGAGECEAHLVATRAYCILRQLLREYYAYHKNFPDTREIVEHDSCLHFRELISELCDEIRTDCGTQHY